MKKYPIKRMLGRNGLLLFLLLAVGLFISGNVNADPTLGNRPHSNTVVGIENSLDGSWGERQPATGTIDLHTNSIQSRIYDYKIAVIRLMIMTIYSNSIDIKIYEKPNLTNIQKSREAISR